MAGAFYFGGIDMAIHKCRKCVWSNKINERHLYCIFPRCIIKTELTEKETDKEKVVTPKARTTCDDKRKRGKGNVSKKTIKTV
jgi:hypothetical protein